MSLFDRYSRIRHPLFPNAAAPPAARARGKQMAIAGTFSELIRASERGVRVERAIFVTAPEGEALTDGLRYELWQRFEVPVYALIVDIHGHVLAWECEAQNGFHVDGPSVDNDMCDCGRAGRRIRTQVSMIAAD